MVGIFEKLRRKTSYQFVNFALDKIDELIKSYLDIKQGSINTGNDSFGINSQLTVKSQIEVKKELLSGEKDYSVKVGHNYESKTDIFGSSEESTAGARAERQRLLQEALSREQSIYETEILINAAKQGEIYSPEGMRTLTEEQRRDIIKNALDSFEKDDVELTHTTNPSILFDIIRQFENAVGELPSTLEVLTLGENIKKSLKHVEELRNVRKYTGRLDNEAAAKGYSLK